MQEIAARYPGWGAKLGASVIAVIAVNLLAGPPLCKCVRVGGGTKTGKEGRRIDVKVCVLGDGRAEGRVCKCMCIEMVGRARGTEKEKEKRNPESENENGCIERVRLGEMKGG